MSLPKRGQQSGQNEDQELEQELAESQLRLVWANLGGLRFKALEAH